MAQRIPTRCEPRGVADHERRNTREVLPLSYSDMLHWTERVDGMVTSLQVGKKEQRPKSAPRATPSDQIYLKRHRRDKLITSVTFYV